VSVSPAADRFDAARAVADAVLYEGYVLYPYRASATKNQLRWQFGVLVPRACIVVDGSERWTMRTECLVAPGANPMLSVRIRCLHVQHRAVECAVADGAGSSGPTGSKSMAAVYVPWDEAVEHVVDIAPLPVASLTSATRDEPFRLAAGADFETVRQGHGPEVGRVVGRVVRRRDAVEGCVRIRAQHVTGDLVKVVVAVENTTDWTRDRASRDEIISHSLVRGAHDARRRRRLVRVVARPTRGRPCRGCGVRQRRHVPVLIGGGDVVLSSPIILYDQPEVAPESPGDLYDATEIDGDPRLARV
jgi:hypothetical protein